jgi:hypothetical protein
MKLDNILTYELIRKINGGDIQLVLNRKFVNDYTIKTLILVDNRLTCDSANGTIEFDINAYITCELGVKSRFYAKDTIDCEYEFIFSLNAPYAVLPREFNS